MQRLWCIRLLLQLIAGLVFSVIGPPVHAQSGSGSAPERVTLAEIARQDIFLPLYGALGKGFFRREGLDVTRKITLGPDHTIAALLGGSADIALGGPDMAVNSAIMAQGESLKIVAAISRFEGSFLVGREKIAPDRFRWDSLKGKSLMGWRSGTPPSLFVESALRNRKIDPRRDIDYRPDVPFPARMRIWREKRVDFAVFYLVDVAKLERNKEGYPLASIGVTAGPSVYTVFLATTRYIRAHPDVIQKWVNAIQTALDWTASAPVDDLVSTAARYLPRAAPVDLAAAYRRYRTLGIWQKNPTVGADAISRVQTMMIESDLMPPGKRVPYETVVEPRFAENAKPITRR